jgi:hypothetical protein
MEKTILDGNQAKLLEAIANDNQMCDCFYLTGGTALAEFFLYHRLSEDLDFFSEIEFDVQAVNVFFAKNKKILKIKKIDYQQSFNRNLFFVDFGGKIVKTEFTFFPFPRIEKKLKKGKLFIDSAIDIAVNKIFTIYQNPRSRDFIDLYFIIQKYGFKIEDLVKKAKIKFDFHIDYLQLGSRFMLAREVKDYPRMIADINHQDWQNYFIDEAAKFSGKILK